jgi:hypothetical protein
MLIKKIAINGLILLFLLTIVFHLLVLFGIITYSIIWGGRITTLSKMYTFEAISISLNVFFLFVIIVKAGYLKVRFPVKMLDVILWVMCILFLLNTVGNLFSVNELEKIIFTPVTLLLSILIFIVVRK